MSEILIYAPNISRENLSGLLNIQLGFLGDKFTISVIKPQSTRFRAPQLRVVLEESDGEMRMEFWEAVVSVAGSLGATRFLFKETDGTAHQLDISAKAAIREEMLKKMSESQIGELQIF